MTILTAKRKPYVLLVMFYPITTITITINHNHLHIFFIFISFDLLIMKRFYSENFVRSSKLKLSLKLNWHTNPLFSILLLLISFINLQRFGIQIEPWLLHPDNPFKGKYLTSLLFRTKRIYFEKVKCFLYGKIMK